MTIFRFSFLLLLLAGCSNEAVETKDLGFERDVQLVVLDDGTRCAIYTGPWGAGGIHCDWK